MPTRSTSAAPDARLPPPTPAAHCLPSRSKVVRRRISSFRPISIGWIIWRGAASSNPEHGRTSWATSLFWSQGREARRCLPSAPIFRWRERSVMVRWRWPIRLRCRPANTARRRSRRLARGRGQDRTGARCPGRARPGIERGGTARHRLPQRCDRRPGRGDRRNVSGLLASDDRLSDGGDLSFDPFRCGVLHRVPSVERGQARLRVAGLRASALTLRLPASSPAKVVGQNGQSNTVGIRSVSTPSLPTRRS
jgi:hypothetical protein